MKESAKPVEQKPPSSSKGCQCLPFQGGVLWVCTRMGYVKIKLPKKIK